MRKISACNGATMLSDLKRCLADGGRDEQDFRRAAAQLLREQFLYADESRDKSYYQLVRDHRDYFANLFDALGWRLESNDLQGWIGALPQLEAGFSPLKLDETLICLLLRLLFEEAVNSLDAQPEGAYVSLRDVETRYRDFGREPPRLTRMKEILGFLRTRGLLRFDADVPLDELTVLVRPAIRVVTGDEVLKRLEELASTAGSAIEPSP